MRSAKIMALTPHTLRVFGQIFFGKVTYFVRGDKLGSESSHAWLYPDCCDSHSALHVVPSRILWLSGAFEKILTENEATGFYEYDALEPLWQLSGIR